MSAPNITWAQRGAVSSMTKEQALIEVAELRTERDALRAALRDVVAAYDDDKYAPEDYLKLMGAIERAYNLLNEVKP